ncbi:conserved hypothetical protein [Gloeothece citriformis PCC 7424]|uniref:Uncharacterized protein n=1 Tax=Gloeothece citriformis (strain PCC 7424) TaxID=65393 RepID=B7KJR5_GLOC7|nr:hypothetical protein [Gloeothece citriformis]ACK69514.1 conserved hypothetical protein [Gloeothece citriformis PCC 7424]
MITHTNISSLLARGTGLILGFALATLNPSPTLALENSSPQNSSQSSQMNFIAQSESSSSSLADGVYLYGQSPEPEQIGQEYLVIRVNQGQVVGAFYMPQSEFNCFYGNVNAQQMNLSVVDPYDNSVHPYSIALQTTSPVAAQNASSVSLTLEGYHQLSKLSENDQRILNVCVQKHQ